MGPQFTRVIRPLDIRAAGEEKHISFLNGIFKTLEEKEERDGVEEKQRKNNQKKLPHFLHPPTDSFPAHSFALHHYVSAES